MLPTLESPGWAVLTLTPQWKAVQLPLLLFVFKGELNTLTKQETQSQQQPRLSHSHTHCSVLSPPWLCPEHRVAIFVQFSRNAMCLPLSQAQSPRMAPLLSLDVDLPAGLRTLDPPQRS